jgi:hypothetical protein
MTTDHADFDTVAEFTTDAEARRAVETLTLEGVGATWEPVGEPDQGVGGSAFRVLVVPGDLPKACRVLGLAEPDPSGDDDDDEPLIPEWVFVAVIFGAALLIIPLIAFFVSFKLSGG